MNSSEAPAPPPEVRSPWLERGTRVGLYQVERLISSGGFGAVYRVSRDGKHFALKLPVPRAVSHSASELQATEQRIIREVVALMTMQHPGIVRVRGFDRWPDPTDGALYIVMDFVDGRPLLRWRSEAKPSVREVVELFRTLALATDEMHRLGVVHRDIKSANVLVADAGNSKWSPVLVDFGLARPTFTPDVTREYMLVGTEGHWSPEHVAFNTRQPVVPGKRFQFTPATDLHALGHLFYEALTGRPPFRCPSPGALMAAVMDETPPAPSTVASGLPSDLDAPVLHLLAKRPEQRTPSGAALAAELDALLSGADERWNAPLEAHSGAGPEAPTTPARGRRGLRLVPPASDTAPAKGAKPPVARPDQKALPIPSGPSAADRAPPASPEKPVAARPSARALAVLAMRTVFAYCVAVAKSMVATLALFVFACFLHYLACGEPRTTETDSSGAAQEAPPSRAAGAPSPPPNTSPASTRPATASVSRGATGARLVAALEGGARLVRSGPAPGAPAERASFLAHAAIVGHVQAGTIEAVLTHPLELRRAPRFEAGTTLAGTARGTEGGGFELDFHQLRQPDGTEVPVEGRAALDARAGVRRPLRAGATPGRIEFDVVLTRTR